MARKMANVKTQKSACKIKVRAVKSDHIGGFPVKTGVQAGTGHLRHLLNMIPAGLRHF